jgi:hypothetical protein
VTWLDFAIENVDTRSLYIDAVMSSKTGIPTASRAEMHAAVEYELRALRYAAGVIDTYKMGSGPAPSPRGMLKRLRFAPTTYEIPPRPNYFDVFSEDITRLINVAACAGYELDQADAALAWADYSGRICAWWLSTEGTSDVDLLDVLFLACWEES